MKLLQLCDRCSGEKSQQADILRDLIDWPSRTVDDISRQIHAYDSLQERARQEAEKRLSQRPSKLQQCEQQLKDYEEQVSMDAVDMLLQGQDVDDVADKIMSDKVRAQLEAAANALRYQPEEIDYRDVEAVLEEFKQRGLLEIDKGRVSITSRGARLLADQALTGLLNKLAAVEMGTHTTRDTGFGAEVTARSRQYEPGDEYAYADIERTMITVLERNRAFNQMKPEDFRIFETQHQTRIAAGIIVDVSASMLSDGKLGAAIEASLALAQLISRDPKDSLKAFTFSEKVRQIPPWAMANEATGGGSTDIRAAMRTFRKAALAEKGDKQAYLITDAEPNTEDGAYIGFENAMAGVVDEALRYREMGITLNVIMLSESAALKEFARGLARKNLGRVLFTSPRSLGRTVIEDYLRAKSAAKSKRGLL